MALQDRARNEPRDLYDLWFLTTRAGIEIGDLIGAIAEKLRFREKEIAGLEDRIIWGEVTKFLSQWGNHEVGMPSKSQARRLGGDQTGIGDGKVDHVG